MAHGVCLGNNGNNTRIRHNANTEGGSSGSPCFTVDLYLFGLHHAGDPNFDPDHKPDYNQAIPISNIVSHLQANNIVVPASMDN